MRYELRENLELAPALALILLTSNSFFLALQPFKKYMVCLRLYFSL